MQCICTFHTRTHPQPSHTPVASLTVSRDAAGLRHRALRHFTCQPAIAPCARHHRDQSRRAQSHRSPHRAVALKAYSRPQAHSAHGHDITRLAPLTSLHCTQRHRVLHRCASHRCDLRHRAPHRRAPHHRSPHRCAPSRRVAHKAGCTLRCIHHLQRSTSTTHLPAPRRHTPCSLAPHNESWAAPAPKLSRLTPCLGRWGLCCTVWCQPVDSSCEL